MARVLPGRVAGVKQASQRVKTSKAQTAMNRSASTRKASQSSLFTFPGPPVIEGSTCTG